MLWPGGRHIFLSFLLWCAKYGTRGNALGKFLSGQEPLKHRFNSKTICYEEEEKRHFVKLWMCFGQQAPHESIRDINQDMEHNLLDLDQFLRCFSTYF